MSKKMIQQSEIDIAREALARASRERSKLAAEVASLQGIPRASPRFLARGLGEAESEQEMRNERLRNARLEERQEKQRLMEAKSKALSEDPSEDLKKLSTEYPILLLPMRLETRFSRTPPELMVRIYPDEIAAETHEAELTETELKAGIDYWKLAWDSDKDKEKGAWSLLTRQFSATRSAWIVQATTPTNISDRPSGEPVFPNVDVRAQSWTRPAQSRVLPDRWIVRAYRSGSEIHHVRAISLPVEEPLALTIDPWADPDEEPSADGPRIDSGITWTVDFDRAVKAGMALRIPLDEEDLQKGFDRLIVMGVKTTLDPFQGSTRLSDLFNSHHYSRGFAFLKQGTPTNNASSAPSGFPPSDPGGSYSFEIERGASLTGEDCDGSLFTRALGIPKEVIDHIARANSKEQMSAKVMNNALWPATLGYFLEAMMGLKGDVVLQARKYFVDYVRGRGPYPAFRIGGTPYGLLPVASIRHTLLNSESTNEEKTISKIIDKRKFWLDVANKIPKVSQSNDPDADLLKILSMDASAQEVRVRLACGDDCVDLLHKEKNRDIRDWKIQRICIIKELSEALSTTGFRFPANLPNCPPADPIPDLQGVVPLLDMTFLDKSYIFKNPLVSQDLTEDKTLEPNYIGELINEIGTGTLENIKNTDLGYKDLLYLILRDAILQEYDSEAFRILVKHKDIPDNIFRYESETPEFDEPFPLMTAWKRLEHTNQEITGNASVTMWDYLHASSAEISSYNETLAYLKTLPSAELHRLLTETMDVCSHRLDTWTTSLATKRIEDMRKKNPLGSYIGGFGWVEDLIPKPAGSQSEIVLPDGRMVYLQEASGGYIQTPSMVHASAAAVIRSGFLTHSMNGESSFDVNLSSQRVRKARWVLDSVRQGQFLGAVLGYHFERGLHNREVEKLIEQLRKLYPMPGGSTNDANGPSVSVSARNVVDGLALRKAWTEKTIPFGSGNLPKDPPVGDDEKRVMEALVAELEYLDDLVDSVADLLTAESVYQIVKGNTAGASASLDTMARGARPHDPEILKQPRTGTTLTHRVLMVLGGEILLVDAWHKSPLTPRAKAEPFLNRWAGQILGNPDTVRCRVKYSLPPQNTHKEMIVALTDLEIRPVDFLELVSTKDGRSELNQRIAEVVLRSVPEAREIEILFAADDSWNRKLLKTFTEILEVAKTINEVISSARPLKPEDLLHPSSAAVQLTGADLLGDEALSRAKDARDALSSEVNRLEREISQMENAGGVPANRSDLVSVLKKASLFGLQGAFPTTMSLTIPEDKELLSMAKIALKELNERLEMANAKKDELAESEESDEKKVKVATELTKIVFGKDFIFLPRFKPAEPGELAASLDAGQKALLDPDQANRDNIMRKWLQQSSRVRMPLERWRKLWLYAEALGVPAARLDVAQLPHIEGAKWAGLPFPTEEERPTSGLLSMVLYRPSILGFLISPSADDEWVGLMLDEWTEMIPSISENTGIAFHFDNPCAEAPQAVLIAAPSTESPSWDLDNLIDTVYDTMDLMRIRLVDSDMLEGLAQVLPTIYLASNTDKNAISTELSSERKRDPKVKVIGES